MCLLLYGEGHGSTSVLQKPSPFLVEVKHVGLDFSMPCYLSIAYFYIKYMFHLYL